MNNDAAYYRLAYRIFADFSGTIAVPAVLAALAGKWLDAKEQTGPRYLILFLLLAFSLTIWMVMKKAKQYQQEYETLIKK